MYLPINEIQSIQIDHTSKCNCLCPQCARVYKGGVNPEMPIGELTLDDYKAVFVPEILANLKQVTQCGNYGDMIASDTSLDCLEWLRSVSDTNMTIMTNGSARNAQWWRRLAQILDGKGTVVFSIDGLEDTNHLYRVNANFNRVIENAKTYIDAGGKARWDYLVFSHNEHQVEDAKALATQLGFYAFAVKKTNRFINEKNYQAWVDTRLQEQVTTRRSEYELSAPSDKYKSASSMQFDGIVEKYGSWANYVDQTPISCKFQKDRSIFLDFEGRIWPCTWTASGIYHYGQNTQKDQIHTLFDHYGDTFNNIRNNSMYEVLEHEWFTKTLVESWGLTTSSKPVEKLMCCGRTCGTSYDFSSASKNNREMFKL